MELGLDAPPWLPSGLASMIVHAFDAAGEALISPLDCNVAEETVQAPDIDRSSRLSDEEGFRACRLLSVLQEKPCRYG